MLFTLCYGRDSSGIVGIFMWPVYFQTAAGRWVGQFDDDGISMEQLKLFVKDKRSRWYWCTRDGWSEDPVFISDDDPLVELGVDLVVLGAYKRSQRFVTALRPNVLNGDIHSVAMRRGYRDSPCCALEGENVPRRRNLSEFLVVVLGVDVGRIVNRQTNTANGSGKKDLGQLALGMERYVRIEGV